jgi:hypothetical protein
MKWLTSARAIWYIIICGGLLYAESVMAIEEPSYQLIKQDGVFECRAYPDLILAQVTVEGDMSDAGARGFRLIAGYIFGKNAANTQTQSAQRIAMTAPVVMQASSQTIAMTAPVTMRKTDAKQWSMYFVMPREYALNTLPTPLDPRVKLLTQPPAVKAVIRFSGFNSEAKTQEKAQLLIKWMHSQGLTPIGEPELARYNPPWTLPFLRRNEVLISYIPQ